MHHSKIFHWHRKVWLHRLMLGRGDFSITLRWAAKP